MDVGDLILYACAVVLVTIVNNACAASIPCEQVCPSLKDESSQVYKACGCDVTRLNPRQLSDSVLKELLAILHRHHPHHHTRYTEKTTTASTTPTQMTSTTRQTTNDVCDMLCAAQLGGRACQCSKPGFPGRK